MAQLDSESPEDYYGRAQGQLKQFLGQDPETATRISSDLLVRNMVVTAWLDGLKNDALREEVARQTGDASSSLTEVSDVSGKMKDPSKLSKDDRNSAQQN